jgi:hypothetical protein
VLLLLLFDCKDVLGSCKGIKGDEEEGEREEK